MKMTLNIIIISIFVSIAYNCSDNPITPPKDFEPGRRDYTWEIDTLDIYYPAYKIWGSSPMDVWSINESDFYHSIWHYDGHNWSTDGILRVMSPHAIYGFSYDKVYIGGTSGEIWNFDGTTWRQINKLSQEGVEYIACENIWGESFNDFYVIGSGPDELGYFNKSFIAHYYNTTWQVLDSKNIKGDIVHLFKNKPDGKIYFRLTKIGGSVTYDSTIIYEYQGTNYYRLYGSIESQNSKADISLINGEVYFILGDKIAKRTSNEFQTLLDIENPNFYKRIWGRNEKDIFLLMTDGLVHYNGTNMEYLFYFSHPDSQPVTQIFDAAIFEKEVFFTVYEPSTNLKLIYHGKLN